MTTTTIDSSETVMPHLLPGATRKRNVLDVLDHLALSSGKKNVLVRVDFNVPMDAHGAITEDSRIRGALQTIRVLLRAKANAILVSHMGRPKLVQANADTAETRQQRKELSLRPVAEHLAQLLGQPVLFGDDCANAKDIVEQLSADGGDVCLLENLRFYKAEEKNGKEFAAILAGYADAYVNDAFGTCHRAHASVSGVPALLDPKACGIGCLVASELACKCKMCCS
jgi:phosphoglycerate kinase